LTPKRVTSLFAVLVLTTAFIVAAVAGPAAAAVRHLDGTVVSKNANDKSFRLSTQSGNLRIRVTTATVFDRLSGFSALRKGLVATKIEPRESGGNEGGGGDDHGGSHGGGHDDGPNHT
jgi:uncharacterized membrane protein YgcG